MADPNTQIDWWIAQTWQEAQGGADSDALVAWLHENGLSAVSSYTILQAALSCSSEEAKQMVFGHPVWAGADAEADLAGAEYTSDTLEPEPEPDATFGLDDWADEIEDDEPVYGEPGYEPPPTATPSRSAGQDGEAPAPRNMLLDAYAEMAEEETAGNAANFDMSGDPLPEAGDMFEEEQADFQPAPVSETELTANMEPEEEALFEAEGPDEDGPEIDADQVFEMDPEWEAEPPSPEPAPVASMVPPPGPAPQPASLQQMQSSEVMSSATTALSEEPAPAPAPSPRPVPAAAPPILRMPPATPAERAATFAAAFGKKSTTLSRPPAGTAGTTSGGPNGGPPSNDTGPAAHAETGPAQVPTDPPQTAPAAAPMPPPLELEPLPEFTAPPPVATAEPLFTAAGHREPAAAPPLFPPKQDQPAADVQPDEPVPADLSVSDIEFESELETPDMNPQQESEEAAAAGDYPAEPDDAKTAGHIPLEVVAEDAPSFETDDIQPEAYEFDDAREHREQDNIQERQSTEDEELPALDWEEELPEFEIEEPEDSDKLNGDGDDGQSDIEDGPARPRKPLLLDPEEEEEEEPLQPGVEGDPENMAEAAKKLGINFRGVDAEDAGIDPEMSKAAKELGISFRENGGGPDTPDDETALEAQKLGISFREESLTGKPPKPLIAKYMPMFLGLIAIFFLLLIAATFSGTIIEWLKN